jgi:cell division protein FtsQ
MHQTKSKKLLVYFFLLIITSSISNNSLNNFKFGKILNINISGLAQEENQILLNKVESLNLDNIFFINKKDIDEIFSSNTLIESFEIFLKYPHTIDIKIEKTNFLAKINQKGKLFLIGSNGKLTPYKFDHNSLPFIFGIPKVREFLKFKNTLDKSKFSYEQIENLYFFPSKRWDLMLKNNILIKLPSNLEQDTLDILYEFLKDDNGNNFSIIDFRNKNQIIVNE